MRLTQRLAMVIVAAVTPVVGVEVYNAYSIIEQARQEQRSTALQYSRQAAWELNRMVDGLQGVMTTVAATPQVHEGDWAACNHFIDSVKTTTPGLISIAVADLNGAIRCGVGALEGVNVRDRDYFKDILAGAEFKIGTYTLGPITGRPLLPFAVPVRSDDEKTTSVVIAALDLQWLNQSIAQRGLPEGGSLTVADANGVIVARQPMPEQFVGNKIPEQYMYLLHEDHAGAIEVTSQDGARRTLGYQPLSQPPLNLYVSAGLAAESADNAAYYAVSRALAVAFAAMAFAILVAWYVSRRFVAGPVAALVHVADRWRKGDLTARAEIQGDDEFARLGQAFDQAIEQAKKREDRITLLVKEITHRVKNQMSVMASMARQSGRTATNVSDFQKAFSNRIMALARSHDLVFADAGEARLRTLIEAQLAPFAGSGRLKLSGPEILIDPQATQYLGMGLHELATNAVKYGALSREGGRVEIGWSILPVDGVDTLRLSWTEQGGPPPAATPTEGFGTVVLDKIVGSALGGRTSYRLEDGGAMWVCEFTAHFTVPAAEAAETQEPA